MFWIPAILIVGTVAVVSQSGNHSDKVNRDYTYGIPKSKLPRQIRFWDDKTKEVPIKGTNAYSYKRVHEILKGNKWVEVSKSEWDKYFGWDDMANDNSGAGYYHGVKGKGSRSSFRSGGKYLVYELGKRS